MQRRSRTQEDVTACTLYVDSHERFSVIGFFSDGNIVPYKAVVQTGHKRPLNANIKAGAWKVMSRCECLVARDDRGYCVIGKYAHGSVIPYAACVFRMHRIY